jgi:uncharacterized membrane protein
VELLRIVVLLAGTITMGLMAGVFMIFSVAVMPGLGRTDDRTFVGAFQAIDRAILNPLFLSTFLGALLLPGLAALLHLPAGARPVLPWILAALVAYLAVVVITGRVHVSLNNEIKAAGQPDQIPDLAAVRSRFESRWVRWNLVRTVLTVLAFGLLTWALVEHTAHSQ